MKNQSPAPTRGIKQTRPGWGFVLPALLIYALVVVYPSLAGSYYAFTAWNGLTQAKPFVGLANVIKVFHDAQALAALKNTFVVAISTTIAQNVIGLGLALLVNANLKTKYLLRTMFFLPVVLTPIIVAFLWQYIYSPDGGLDRLLELARLSSLKQNWLGDGNLALWCAISVIVWQSSGYAMVIYLAGLQGIPGELYEAAVIDGSSAWTSFWRITLPLLAPATTITFMLAMIAGLKTFDQILGLTQGGPGYATETLSTMLYKQAFVFGDYGYGMAVALLLGLLVGGLALLQLSVLRRLEVEP